MCRFTGYANGKTTPWNSNWLIEGPLGSLTWDDVQLCLTHGPCIRRRLWEEIRLPEWESQDSDRAIPEEFLSTLKVDRQPKRNGADNTIPIAVSLASLERANRCGQWIYIPGSVREGDAHAT